MTINQATKYNVLFLGIETVIAVRENYFELCLKYHVPRITHLVCRKGRNIRV